MFFETALLATGISGTFRAGFGQKNGVFYANVPYYGFGFEFSPDNNSGQWRIYVQTTNTGATYTNTSVAVAADTAYKLEIDVNAAWNSINFLINGAVVGTLTTGIPAATSKGCPYWQLNRGASTTNYRVCLDSWSIYYPVVR